MLTPFRVKGFNAETGRNVEVVLLAQSEADARQQGESCGMERVTAVLEAHAADELRVPGTQPRSTAGRVAGAGG